MRKDVHTHVPRHSVARPSLARVRGTAAPRSECGDRSGSGSAGCAAARASNCRRSSDRADRRQKRPAGRSGSPTRLSLVSRTHGRSVRSGRVLMSRGPRPMQWAIITAWARRSSERLPIVATVTSFSVHRPASPSASVTGTIAGGRARRNLACDYYAWRGVTRSSGPAPSNAGTDMAGGRGLRPEPRRVAFWAWDALGDHTRSAMSSSDNCPLNLA